VIGLDYDESAVAHVKARYPRVEMLHGNLAALPLPDAAVDVVVNFQVIEHLWDQGQFVAECLRVLRPGGVLLMSTPNRITFSPGRDTPINPFHTRELNAAELTELLTGEGFLVESMLGVFHGTGLAELDARHGGSIIDAQIARALADAPWPAELLADVASVTTEDFDLTAERDIDESLDLVAIAVRP
jgi:SAM-dependent methyltransferase